MNPFEQFKAEIEARRDALSENISEEDLSQLNALLDRLSANAKETITKIAESLPEEQKEAVSEKVKAKMNDQEVVRRQKMDALAEKGIDPFGQAFAVTAHAEDLRSAHGEKTSEELEAENNEVSIAGRIMSKRRMGKIGFMHIQDRSGKIQVVVKKQVVGDEVYELFKASDLGDIIGIKGKVIKTNAGELSVEVQEYTHLTKALRPLPEKFHGFTDKEERYRRRYVDLIMNEDSRRVAFL